MSSPYLGSIETELHWLTSGSPGEMVAFLGERGSPGRWQLFACHCCWRIKPLLVDERSLRAVAVAERHAEGLVDLEEVSEALQEAQAAEVHAWEAGRPANLAYAATTALRCLQSPRRAFLSAASATRSGEEVERLAQCQLLRELFGNPFRPVCFEERWRTPLVLAMARQAYEAEHFIDLPILADALEDVGCDEEAILTHCRGPGPHVRGCWLMDCILERE